MNDVLPEAVVTKIGTQYATAIKKAMESFLDAYADEDSITGGLLSQIKSEVRACLYRIKALNYDIL